jgi:hypothetical protein
LVDSVTLALNSQVRFLSVCLPMSYVRYPAAFAVTAPMI